MRCANCGREADARWKFCPSCGAELESKERALFGDVFERMEREMSEMNKALEKNFEFADLMPMFPKNTRPMRGSGFSIKITQGTGREPKVSIQTFGDVPKKAIEKEVDKMGFRDRISKAIRPEKTESREAQGICFDGAKSTEEPVTCMKKVGSKTLVEIKLPGVRNANDIEVKKLENSIEVKAIAGEKAYFKILTKPPKTNIFNQTFKNGVLTIELA